MSNAQQSGWLDDTDQWPVTVLSTEDAKFWQRVNRNPPRPQPLSAALSVANRVVPITAYQRRQRRAARRVRLLLTGLAYCVVTVAAMVGGWVFIVVMVYGFSSFTG